jgi:predicted Fe-S protein YdhL (DUF1289 family)
LQLLQVFAQSDILCTMSQLTRLLTRADQVLMSDSVHMPSPCVSICVVNPSTQLCEGCLRNIQEIAAWGQMPSAQQRGVWQKIQVRCAEKLRAQA